jgi:hypothetical protein
MPDVATLADETHAALAGRVTRLARLIETHPAFDLLAEYEAVFVDRHPCASETVPCLEQAADHLLTRIDDAIRALEQLTVAPGPAAR